MPPAANEKEGAKVSPATGNFRIEMGDRLNRNFLWPIDQRLLRGRWTRANIPGVEFDDKFKGMPDLPGILLDVDIDGRTYGMMDPLAHPKNRALLEKAQLIGQRAWGVKMVPEFMPDGFLRFRDLTPDQIKSVVFYARRFYDNRQCNVLRGRMPAMDQVFAMPGRVSYENFNSSAAVEHKREPVPYIPPKPDEDSIAEASVADMVME